MTRPPLDVVGLGENSVDSVYRVRGALAPNAKLPITGHRVLPGGQVAAALFGCTRFGLRCEYLGAFGHDEHGRLVRDTLKKGGVGIEHAPVREVPNRHALIVLDEQTGDRTVLWERDPALALAPGDLQPELITRARLLHVDNVDEEAAIAAARIALASGLQVTTDIDRVTERTPELIQAATCPIFAEPIPAALTGERDPEDALRALRERHAGLLCVTLGRRGALLLDGDTLHHQPAFDVKAVDTTGAGDIFRAGLIYGLLRGYSSPAMLLFATAAAAISCTREGAIGGAPSLTEVERMATTGTELKVGSRK
jgi:sugar/nucleoside kinase (ribokinase family)